MADIEKVKKSLEICISLNGDCTPDKCPYYDIPVDEIGLCWERLMKDALAMLKEQPDIVRCKDCKHGSVYMTEDVCGETLIECNRPCLGDVIEIHGWKWFCADGEPITTENKT